MSVFFDKEKAPHRRSRWGAGAQRVAAGHEAQDTDHFAR
jgi:hypothetical protein